MPSPRLVDCFTLHGSHHRRDMAYPKRHSTIRGKGRPPSIHQKHSFQVPRIFHHHLTTTTIHTSPTCYKVVTPPPSSFIKVNTDAEISSSHSALAVIARDSHGAVQKVWARIAPKFSPFQAKVMVLHWAVQLATQENWSHVLFEGDSKVCFEVATAKEPCNARAISHFVADIRDLASSFVVCNFL